jgi:hypothetical protein
MKEMKVYPYQALEDGTKHPMIFLNRQDLPNFRNKWISTFQILKTTNPIRQNQKHNDERIGSGNALALEITLERLSLEMRVFVFGTTSLILNYRQFLHRLLVDDVEETVVKVAVAVTREGWHCLQMSRHDDAVLGWQKEMDTQ